MNWLDNFLSKTPLSKSKSSNIPEGMWIKCPGCSQVLYCEQLKQNLDVCPKCGHHMRINPRVRLLKLLDKDSAVEMEADMVPKDILKFKDLKRYKDRISAAQKQTGEKDALIVYQGSLYKMPVVACAFNFNFMGGSMGSVVGSKFVKAAEYALSNNCPLICFSASGGARMQEALFSLMQMAKTSAVLAKMQEAGVPFISVLTDPTLGGVSASLAMLGDVNIAEPNALIGFAGPRVIEQTVREKLPEGFQRSEFLLAKGAIDMIVSRLEMRKTLGKLLAMLTNSPSPNLDMDNDLGLDLEEVEAGLVENELEPTAEKQKTAE